MFQLRYKNITNALILVGLIQAGSAWAQVIDPQNVLIRNVHLVAADSENEEFIVNILIRDNKLEVVFGRTRYQSKTAPVRSMGARATFLEISSSGKRQALLFSIRIRVTISK